MNTVLLNSGGYIRIEEYKYWPYFIVGSGDFERALHLNNEDVMYLLDFLTKSYVLGYSFTYKPTHVGNKDAYITVGDGKLSIGYKGVNGKTRVIVEYEREDLKELVKVLLDIVNPD